MKKLLLLLSCWGVHSASPQEATSPQKTASSRQSAHPPVGFGPALWKFKTGGKIFSSPALYRGLVLIGSEDKNCYAIHAADGKLAWKFATGGAVHSSPTIVGNIAVFASYDGYFYAVDAASGMFRWKFQTNGEKKVGARGLWTMKPETVYMDDPFDFYLSSAAADREDGRVYFGSGDGNLYALNAKDGRLQWKFATGGIVHSSPVLYKGILYFGSWDRYLYAVDSRTGKEKWKFRTRQDTAYHLLEGIQASPLAYDGIVYFGARDGYFYALDAATGRPVWEYPANNSWILTTAAVKDDRVYLGTSDSYLLLALDAKTGKEKFRAAADGYVYSSPTIAGHTIYFGDFTGQMLAVDLHSDGKILDRFMTAGRKENAPAVLNKGKIDFPFMTRGMDLSYYSTTVTGMTKLYSLGPILSKPLVSGGTLYFGSADSCLYAIKLHDQ